MGTVLRVIGVSMFAVAACSEPSDAPGDGSVGHDEPSELHGITQLHNEVRATVGVPPVSWDPRLAAIAAAWAAQCVDKESPSGLVDHNPNRSQEYPTKVGENIFAASGIVTARDAVDSWAAERVDYDYASNSCSKICGHYTQVVWRATTMIGCAMNTCSGLRWPNTIVCNYAPAGNVSGERPY